MLDIYRKRKQIKFPLCPDIQWWRSFAFSISDWESVPSSDFGEHPRHQTTVFSGTSSVSSFFILYSGTKNSTQSLWCHLTRRAYWWLFQHKSGSGPKKKHWLTLCDLIKMSFENFWFILKLFSLQISVWDLVLAHWYFQWRQAILILGAKRFVEMFQNFLNLKVTNNFRCDRKYIYSKWCK